MNTKYKYKAISILKMFIILVLLTAISGCRELSDMLDPDKDVSKKELKAVEREKPNLSFETAELDVDPDSDDLTEESETDPAAEKANPDSVGDNSNVSLEKNDNSSMTEENTGEDNTDTGQPENSQPESSQPDALTDAEFISGKLWKIDDDNAEELESDAPTFIAFGKPTKYNNGYGGEMQISKQGIAKPEIGRYVITSKNKMILTIDGENKSTTYKMLNGGKNLQIGEDLRLTEY